MKQFYTFLFVTMVSFAAVAQGTVFSSSFEEWTSTEPSGVPLGWATDARTNLPLADITQSTDAQEGDLSVRLVRDNTGHQRFATQSVSVEDGTEYTYTFWIKGTGDIRIGLFDERSTGAGYATYSAWIAATSTWTQHSLSILCANTTTNGNFIFSIRSTGTAGILLDNVIISVQEPVEPELITISEIQFTTVPGSGNTFPSPLEGQQVITQGVVTAVVPNPTNPTANGGFYIQDAPGAWNGIYVFNPNHTLSVGNEVVVTATVEERFGNTQLAFVSNIEVLEENVALPASTVITTLQASTEEQWEGVLVTVLNAECVNASAPNGLWFVNDGSGVLQIGNSMHVATRQNQVFYNITGPILYEFSNFRLHPRGATDIQNLGTVNVNEIATERFNFSVFPNPATDRVTLDFSITELSTLEVFNAVGQRVFAAQISAHEGNYSFPVNQFNTGLYHIVLSNNTGVATKKLVVK
ncbi:MAG: T9SS type A sorting domain-containing protein [Luteibaculaceae bacterium]